MRLGTVLRRYRSMREITVRDLAKEIGIAFATLSRIENGLDCDSKTLMTVLVWLTGKGTA
jgi:DNA-binding XRE family transcriptional regulator